MEVAIIGGGIVGLTTALQLNNNLRGNNITVIAASFDDVVSYVAAGLFRVGHSFNGPTKEITMKWIKDSYDYYNDISNHYEAMQTGVGHQSTYIYANSGPEVVQVCKILKKIIII